MKKTYKTLLSIWMLMLICTLVLSACGSSNDSTEEDEEDTAKEEEEDTTEYSITTIGKFHNGLARFQAANDLYGYIDTTGNVVVDPIYTSAQADFDEKAALVSKDETEMLIDRKGKVLAKFDFDYDAIGTFENGYIWVQTNEETVSKNVPVMTYYNEKGEKAFCIKNVSHVEELGEMGLYCEMVSHSKSGSSFNQYGYAIVMSEDGGYSYKLIFKDGNYADFIPSDHYIIGAYGNYITLSTKTTSLSGGRYYIDYSNKKLIDASKISSLGASMIELKNSDAYGNKIYSCTSHLSTPNVDKSIGNDCNMLLLVTKNEILIKLEDVFPDAAYFKAIESGVYNNKTYYTIYMKNQSGVAFYSVIDENGKILIDPTKEYELGNSYSEKSGMVTLTHYQAYSYNSGLCKAKDSKTGLYGFIDLQGNWVIKPKYQNVTDFSEFGTDAYAVVDDVTIINKKGEVVFTAQHDNS